MKFRQTAAMALVCVTLVMGFGSCKRDGTAGGSGKEVVIVMDPGGTYVSTKSMEKNEANPYPYNELELIAKEYSDSHPGVTVRIVDTSTSGTREELLPLLRTGRAPDIVYQNFGDFKNSDIGEDFFVVIDEYMEKPNPYVPGNQRWKDQFVYAWVEVMRAMDGKLRFIPLDSVAVGMAYNKDLFAQAGITKAPETYKEFIEALDKLHALPGVVPYLTPWVWYDIFLEGSLLANKVDELDVLIPDGVLDGQEIARGYDKGLLSFQGPEYREWAILKKDILKYFPAGWQAMDTMAAFVNGQVGIHESIGGMIRQIYDDSARTFEVGFMPYPLVTTETSPLATSGMIRGSAGYSTCVNITNTAVKNGTVEQCIDRLMYLSNPEINERLVNPKGTLSPGVLGADPIDLYVPFNSYVEDDMARGFKDWHAMVMYGAFDGEWYSLYVDNLRLAYMLGEISLDDFLRECDEGVRAAIKRVEVNSNWDKSKW
jgi:ABC-type glycerol-3-phosphate transport system substrate-binding protein